MIYEAVKRGVAAGYLDARVAMHEGRSPKYEWKLAEGLDEVPGYRGRRATTETGRTPRQPPPE